MSDIFYSNWGRVTPSARVTSEYVEAAICSASNGQFQALGYVGDMVKRVFASELKQVSAWMATSELWFEDVATGEDISAEWEGPWWKHTDEEFLASVFTDGFVYGVSTIASRVEGESLEFVQIPIDRLQATSRTTFQVLSPYTIMEDDFSGVVVDSMVMFTPLGSQWWKTGLWTEIGPAAYSVSRMDSDLSLAYSTASRGKVLVTNVTMEEIRRIYSDAQDKSIYPDLIPVGGMDGKVGDVTATVINSNMDVESLSNVKDKTIATAVTKITGASVTTLGSSASYALAGVQSQKEARQASASLEKFSTFLANAVCVPLAELYGIRPAYPRWRVKSDGAVAKSGGMAGTVEGQTAPVQ